MMINILIIIDNTLLYDRIKNIIIEKNRKDCNVVFKHSSIKSEIWDHPDQLGVINVKKKLDWIINNFNLVISVHCFQFFPKRLVENVRCINVHPGYNPINRGWYPQVFSIIHNLPVGATIHEMDEKLDHGSIIARKFVEKMAWDTSLSLYNRVLDMEIYLFKLFFNRIVDNKYKKINPENEGILYLKSDFFNFCEISLDQKGTFGEFYNLLRALSHGEYKNAFFKTEDGEKVYMKLKVEKESS